MYNMVLPVNVETYEAHFTSRGWTTPQNQVDAGYNLFIQPSASTAAYEQVHDIGTLITGAALVNVLLAQQDIVSGITLTPTLSISADGSSWTDYAGVFSVFASNFRYVKIKLEASGGGTALLRISEVRVVVSLKIKRDGGSGTASSGDSGGTTVTFNQTFIDITSLTVTAKYQALETKGITAIYDFVDAPNPTDFKVLLYSNNTGTRISGDFSWSAQGY